MIAIKTRDLTRRFGEVTAVEDLNLKIPVGSLFGLIGPNGAGKTTTLRMLAGLLEPSSGEIRINGLAIHQYWQEIQWQIGYMPDFFGVYEDLLVWEYLDFFGRCYKLTPNHRRQVTAELLDLVDLAEKQNSYVHMLSRGMRQRLCLAHALVHDPQVLLLDEPASGLDPRARVEMRELLRELRAMGKTIVLSSHILTELAELCDSVAIMEKGHLVISGSMEDIRSRVHGKRTLRIQVLTDPVEVKTILQSQPSIGKIYSTDGNAELSELEVEYLGDTAGTADLLETLVAHRVRVVSFNEQKSNLEELYMLMTKGEVS